MVYKKEMNIDKAILVCNNFLKCSEIVSWTELDTPQFKEALKYLINLAQEQSDLLSK